MIFTTVLLGGCSRGNPLQSTPETGPPSQIVLVGNNQEGPAGVELPAALTVIVLDSEGRPVRNQIVNFVVTRGGGQVYAGAAVTDSDGQARDWWTLGSVPGVNELEARAVDSWTGEPLVFGRFIATGR